MTAAHWHSPSANIPASAMPSGDRRRRHAWFTEKDPGGALAFELDAARPAIARWARARFARLRKQGGTVARPRLVIEQLLDTPTVNLTSTHVESGALAPDSQLDLPATFFVDAEGLSDTLGLAPPPPFNRDRELYASCLEKFGVRLEDGAGFVQAGDTHFCFVVTERAFEDQVVLREALELGLLTRRLAACLLMVDPWSPRPSSGSSSVATRSTRCGHASRCRRAAATSSATSGSAAARSSSAASSPTASSRTSCERGPRRRMRRLRRRVAVA